MSKKIIDSVESSQPVINRTWVKVGELVIAPLPNTLRPNEIAKVLKIDRVTEIAMDGSKIITHWANLQIVESPNPNCIGLKIRENCIVLRPIDNTF